MLELNKINVNSRNHIIDICTYTKEMFVDLYGSVLSEKEIIYLQSFITPPNIKKELTLDDAQYYLIKLNNKKIGFLQFYYNKYIKCIYVEKLHFIKQHQTLQNYKEIHEHLKNFTKEKNYKGIITYINNTNTELLKTFEILDFKINQEIAKYFGSDVYVYGYDIRYYL